MYALRRVLVQMQSTTHSQGKELKLTDKVKFVIAMNILQKFRAVHMYEFKAGPFAKSNTSVQVYA